MSHRLYRRLFIAFLIIAATALLCWQILPRIGVDIPWWVPFIGFVVILIATLSAPGLSDSRGESPDDDPNAPIPFRPPEDEGEGISAADRERFG